MATVSKQLLVTGPPPKEHPHGRRILVPVILVSVLAILIIIVATACGGGGGPYRARVIGHTMLNPALVAVRVQVTNTGTTAGTPKITITVSGAAGANTSTDVVTPHSPIRAGQTVTVNDAITVSGNQGAAALTQFSASTG
jgi:hypothetical protein